MVPTSRLQLLDQHQNKEIGRFSDYRSKSSWGLIYAWGLEQGRGNNGHHRIGAVDHVIIEIITRVQVSIDCRLKPDQPGLSGFQIICLIIVIVS